MWDRSQCVASSAPGRQMQGIQTPGVEVSAQARHAVWLSGRITMMAGALLFAILLVHLLTMLGVVPRRFDVWEAAVLVSWLVSGVLVAMAVVAAEQGMMRLARARGRASRLDIYIDFITAAAAAVGTSILTVAIVAYLGNSNDELIYYVFLGAFLLQLALLFAGVVALVLRSMARLNWLLLAAAFLLAPYLVATSTLPYLAFMCGVPGVLFPLCWLGAGRQLMQDSRRMGRA